MRFREIHHPAPNISKLSPISHHPKVSFSVQKLRMTRYCWMGWKGIPQYKDSLLQSQQKIKDWGRCWGVSGHFQSPLRTDRAAAGGQGWTIYRKHLGNTPRTSIWDSETILSKNSGSYILHPTRGSLYSGLSLLRPFWLGDMNICLYFHFCVT